MIEYFKTIVLWFLILSSVFLTYQIWTFQPEYAILRSTEYIENTTIGEEKRIAEVILPKQIIIHNTEASFSPINRIQFLEDFFEVHRGISFEVRSTSDSLNHFYGELDGIRGLEFTFTESITEEVLKEFFQPGDINSLLVNEIDRIILYVNVENDKERVDAKLISLQEKIYVTAETNISVNLFKSDIEKELTDHFYEVFPLEVLNYGTGFKKLVYLPTEPLLINNVTYLTKPVSPDHFKQTLFSDPNFVKHYMQLNGEETFTDGNRMVNVLNSGHVLRYMNPTFGEVIDRNSKHILLSAIDFLNGHGGLTNSFYYDSNTSVGNNEEIKFRLVIDGIPVYQSNYGVNDLFEITLNRINGNQFAEYVRPLFFVEDEPLYVTKAEKLASGHALIEALNKKEDFNRFLLTDINIGFTMVKRQSFVIFEPRWFIQYNGNWEVVSVAAEENDSEGSVNGLE